MATDPAVTGPGVWLQLVQQEVENTSIDNAGASSYFSADPTFTDLADPFDTSSEEDLVLPSLELEMENTAIENAGALTNGFADPTFTFDTSSEEDLAIVLPSLELEMENVGTQGAGSRDEDELVLPPISVPRSVEENGFDELEMENTAIENAGALTDGFADPTFTDLADPFDTSSEEDLAIVLPSLELDMENIGTQGAGSSDEEELVLPPISVPRSVEENGFDALHLGPLELIREESEDDSYVTHTCRNSCSPEDENTDTHSSLDALVELGCQCRGSVSRMCIKCLLKWFGPRIMLEKDTTCEVCQTRMNESVKKTVLRALADHTGGREILIEALGPPLIRAHNARGGLGRMDPVVEEDDVNVNELPDIPNGAAHASLVPLAAPSDAPPPTPISPSTPAPGSPGSDLPVPAPVQQQRRSFWTKFRRYMCCATPTAVLDPQ